MTTIRRGYRDRISRGDQVRVVNGRYEIVPGTRTSTPVPDTRPDLGWRIETSRTQYTRGWDELSDDERAELRAQFGDEEGFRTMYFRRAWSHE